MGSHNWFMEQGLYEIQKVGHCTFIMLKYSRRMDISYRIGEMKRHYIEEIAAVPREYALSCSFNPW